MQNKKGIRIVSKNKAKQARQSEAKRKIKNIKATIKTN